MPRCRVGKKSKGKRFAIGTHACLQAIAVHPQNVLAVYIRKDKNIELNQENDRYLKKDKKYNKEKKDHLDKSKQNKYRVNHEVALAAKQANLKVVTTDLKQLDKIAPGHQGAIVELSGQTELHLEKLLQKPSALVLGLDGIEDPHNLGAILRTAWLLGVDALITREHHSVGLTPAVHKVACGGVEHVPILTVSKFSDISSACKDAGFWIYGLSGEEGHTSGLIQSSLKSDRDNLEIPRFEGGNKNTKSDKQSYSCTNLWEFKPAQKNLVLVGSEEKGLRQTTKKLCDDLIFIPQTHQLASYNASVAVAITMAHIRQYGYQQKLF